MEVEREDLFMLIDFLMDGLYKGNPEESLNAIKKSKVKDTLSDYYDKKDKEEQDLHEDIINNLDGSRV